MRDVKSSLLASENNFFKEDKTMRTINFYDYVSKRYATNDTRENRVRELVYAFKSGQRAAVDHAVKVVSDLLIKWYGVDCESYVFCCVPASNNGKYIRRFKRFAAELTKRTGIQNGTEHINIFGQREAKHNNANHIVSESYGYIVSADPEFFANKNVILFDDLITTGDTANEFAAELESVGANVLGAMFLARTKMMKNN